MNKNKLLLLLAILVYISQACLAYNAGEKVTKDGFVYEILTTGGGATVKVIGCSQTGIVEIPQTVTLGDEVFTIKRIGGGTTASWSNEITSITIPNTVTQLDTYSLYGANLLTTVEIPASVTSYIPYALASLSGLISITVAEGNSKYESVDGVLYTKGKTELVGVPQGKNFVDGKFYIDENATKVWRGALHRNPFVKEVYIPASLVDLDDNAWPELGCMCAALEKFVVDEDNMVFCSDEDGVLLSKDKSKLWRYPTGRTNDNYTVPNSVKVIATRGITQCSALRSIDLGQVETLESMALSGLSSLNSVFIPASLTSMDGAISACSNIRSYTIEDGNLSYKSINDDGVIYSADGTSLLFAPAKMTEYTFPESVTKVKDYAFNNSRIENLTIPGRISEIGQYAFRDGAINEIVFEEPSSLQTIAKYTFYDCAHLASITLPKSVTTIDSYAFQGCKTLQTITVPDGSQLKTIRTLAFRDCPIKDFVFNGSCDLTTIGNDVFEDMIELKSITLPRTVQTISSNAFLGCTSLEEVNFADDAVIASIGAGAFANCSALKTFEIPQNVVSIGREAFRGCTALTSVSLSASTQSIDPEAFKGCVNLASFEVNAANPYYSTVKNMLCTKDKKTLVLFPAGLATDDITLLPPSLTAIGDYAFYMCDPLTNIVIPKNVRSIGKRAFGLCENLESVAFLSDDMFPVSGINQTLNEQSFDDGQTEGVSDKRPDITLYVRKDALASYQNNEFYKKFNGGAAGIKTSFTKKHDGSVSDDETDDFFPLSNTSMALLGTKAKVHTYIVPKQAKDLEGTVRSVNMIGDYAFDGADVTEVVMLDNIRQIGAKAFWTNKDDDDASLNKIRDIFFVGNDAVNYLSTVDFELPAEYKEFLPGQHIYVKKARLEAYKAAMPSFASQIDYRIPFTMSAEYGTFCREFDTDFSELNISETKEGIPNVIAFTTGGYGTGKTKEGEDISWVRMHSINEGSELGDGTYIPANTPVLLRAVDGQSKENFFYQIHEDTQPEYTEMNIMKGVTISPTIVHPIDGEYTNFLISGGQLHKMTVDREFPVHKAYLQLPTSILQNTAKVQLMFEDSFEEEQAENPDAPESPDVPVPDSTTDGITTIDTTTSDSAKSWYTLLGTRVGTPQKGIFIRNGRKIVIK